MKNTKPIALILFGMVTVLCIIGYTARGYEFDVIAFPIMCIGFFLSLVGLIWALKQK